MSYHYLTDQECGRVRVEYYNASHVLLGTDDSGLHCAPGNGKTQWFVSESFSSTTVEHVHVELEDGSGTFNGSPRRPSWVLMACSSLED